MHQSAFCTGSQRADFTPSTVSYYHAISSYSEIISPHTRSRYIIPSNSVDLFPSHVFISCHLALYINPPFTRLHVVSDFVPYLNFPPAESRRSCFLADSIPPGPCRGMKCQNGDCIGVDSYCDITRDCPDGEDEQGCSQYHPFLTLFLLLMSDASYLPNWPSFVWPLTLFLCLVNWAMKSDPSHPPSLLWPCCDASHPHPWPFFVPCDLRWWEWSFPVSHSLLWPYSCGWWKWCLPPSYPDLFCVTSDLFVAFDPS